MHEPRHDDDREAAGATGAPAPAAPATVPSDLRARQEALLDEAVEETFPASDPIAPARLLQAPRRDQAS